MSPRRRRSTAARGLSAQVAAASLRPPTPSTARALAGSATPTAQWPRWRHWAWGCQSSRLPRVPHHVWTPSTCPTSCPWASRAGSPLSPRAAALWRVRLGRGRPGWVSPRRRARVAAWTAPRHLLTRPARARARYRPHTVARSLALHRAPVRHPLLVAVAVVAVSALRRPFARARSPVSRRPAGLHPRLEAIARVAASAAVRLPAGLSAPRPCHRHGGWRRVGPCRRHQGVWRRLLWRTQCRQHPLAGCQLTRLHRSPAAGCQLTRLRRHPPCDLLWMALVPLRAALQWSRQAHPPAV